MSRLPPVDNQSWDAIIVGGGVNGLAAAAYLSRAGYRVLLLEANESLGGRAENSALADGFSIPVAAEKYATVDRQLVEDFGLYRRGLRFVQRAMQTVVLRPGGRHLILPHDYFGARASIRNFSAADADAYGGYRTSLFRTARRLRRLWHYPARSESAGANRNSVADWITANVLPPADVARVDAAARQSANAYLQGWFENETVKTALGFDATRGGLTPDDSGSALVLFWRAAQEVSGLQGALGQIGGGSITLATAVAEAARHAGAVLLPRARVARIEADGRRARGVTLETGTTIEARCVISDLRRERTFLDLVVPDALPMSAFSSRPRRGQISSARVILALSGAPPFVALGPRELAGRLIIADRTETAAEARGAALLGRLPPELLMEVTVPTVLDDTLGPEGRHAIAVRVPYLPAEIDGGWDARESELRRRVLSGLEDYAPGLRDRIVDDVVITPKDLLSRYGNDVEGGNSVSRFLHPADARIKTPVAGLYMCSDADHAGAAGHSGRLAAAVAMRELEERD